MLYICNATRDFEKYAVKDTDSGEVNWYHRDEVRALEYHDKSRVIGAIELTEVSQNHHPYLGLRSPFYWLAAFRNGRYVVKNNSSKEWHAREDLLTEEELITLLREGCEIYGASLSGLGLVAKPCGEKLVDVCCSWQTSYTTRCRALGVPPDDISFAITDDEITMNAWSVRGSKREIRIPSFVTKINSDYIISNVGSQGIRVIIPRSCDTIVGIHNNQGVPQGVGSLIIEEGQRALSIKSLRVVSNVLSEVKLPKRVVSIDSMEFLDSHDLTELRVCGNIRELRDCWLLASHLKKLYIDGIGLHLTTRSIPNSDRLAELHLGKGVRSVDVKYLGYHRTTKVLVRAYKDTEIKNKTSHIILEQYE